MWWVCERGMMRRRTDARGVFVEWEYDALDRVTKTDYPEGEDDITYIYDDPAMPFSRHRLTAIVRGGEDKLIKFIVNYAQARVCN